MRPTTGVYELGALCYYRNNYTRTRPNEHIFCVQQFLLPVSTAEQSSRRINFPRVRFYPISTTTNTRLKGCNKTLHGDRKPSIKTPCRKESAAPAALHAELQFAGKLWGCIYDRPLSLTSPTCSCRQPGERLRPELLINNILIFYCSLGHSFAGASL